MLSRAAEPNALLRPAESSSWPVTSSCLWHLRHRELGQASCCYQRGRLATGISMGGLRDCGEVCWFGGFTPVLAGAAPQNPIWTYGLIPICQ